MIDGVPGNDPLTMATSQASVTIRDVNDSPPTFNQKEYYVSLSENTAPGTPLPLEITVQDPDVVCIVIILTVIVLWFPCYMKLWCKWTNPFYVMLGAVYYCIHSGSHLFPVLIAVHYDTFGSLFISHIFCSHLLLSFSFTWKFILIWTTSNPTNFYSYSMLWTTSFHYKIFFYQMVNK